MTDKEIEVIIKPIFTKMYKANFSACEYGIECYKKGMEYQGIKELQIENDNLIKRVKELEKENAELKEKYVKNICDCEICDTYCNSLLIKLKDLLKKMYFLYFDPCVTNKDLENRDKLLEEVKQFIKE